MPDEIQLTPAAGATPNPLGITLSTSASVQVFETPEPLVNKDITGIALDTVDAVGLYISKGSFSAIIPWDNIIVFTY